MLGFDDEKRLFIECLSGAIGEVYLNITYLSDTTGVYLRYIPEGKINKIPLLKVMNLDRLNSKNQVGSDGFFDFVEGYTVNGKTVVSSSRWWNLSEASGR